MTELIRFHKTFEIFVSFEEIDAFFEKYLKTFKIREGEKFDIKCVNNFFKKILSALTMRCVVAKNQEALNVRKNRIQDEETVVFREQKIVFIVLKAFIANMG